MSICFQNNTRNTRRAIYVGREKRISADVTRANLQNVYNICNLQRFCSDYCCWYFGYILFIHKHLDFGPVFLPVVVFAILDIYYLKLERKFRFLFDQVRLDEHEIDFSMKLTNDPIEIIKAKARTQDCIKSPIIYLFYPLMLSVLVSVLVSKLTNIA